MLSNKHFNIKNSKLMRSTTTKPNKYKVRRQNKGRLGRYKNRNRARKQAMES